MGWTKTGTLAWAVAAAKRQARANGTRYAVRRAVKPGKFSISWLPDDYAPRALSRTVLVVRPDGEVVK